MTNILKKLIEEAQNYERGKMLNDDSEIEIDIFEDEDVNSNEPYVWVSDYSESRGNAEPVKKICKADKIPADDIVSVCNKYGWAHCL